MHGRKPSRFATVEGEAKQLSVPTLRGSLTKMHGRKPSRFATVEGEAKWLSAPGLHGSPSFDESTKSEILQALHAD